jgi:hypothetical protein
MEVTMTDPRDLDRRMDMQRQAEMEAHLDGQATPPCGVFADCTITAGGYDFREERGLQMCRLTRRAPI